MLFFFMTFSSISYILQGAVISYFYNRPCWLIAYFICVRVCLKEDLNKRKLMFETKSCDKKCFKMFF